MALDGAVGPGRVADLLRDYSCEVTTRDRDSLDAARDLLVPGSEVFVASLPKDDPRFQVEACARLRRDGLEPVPHVVARNYITRSHLAESLKQLAGEAGVRRMLLLGGDRDRPAGDLHSGLQILETGLLQPLGVERVFISCYPERHPRISDAALYQARAAKLQSAAAQALDVTLISQFCFDAAPMIAMTERLRRLGVTAPIRLGLAGPTSRVKLIKYALICGVGPSLRAMQERQGLMANFLTTETPTALVAKLAGVDPALGINQLHFFTFGSLAETAKWVASLR